MNKFKGIVLLLCLASLGVGCTRRVDTLPSLPDYDTTTTPVEGVEEPVVEEEITQNPLINTYQGNYFENDFLGLKFRYPENWFTDESSDTILNMVKELGLNESVNLSEVKLPRVLHVANFTSDDTYVNSMDVSIIPSLDALITEEDVIDGGVLGDTETSEVTIESTTPSSSDTEGSVTEATTPFDLNKLKELIPESQARSGFTVLSVEEPYEEERWGLKVYSIETITQLYGENYQMITSFVELGENLLMVVNYSVNEPNGVDKLENLDQFIHTLEVGNIDLERVYETYEPLVVEAGTNQNDVDLIEADIRDVE